MMDQRERFERAIEVFEMPEPAFERMLRRQAHRRRNQRLAAGAVGLAVAAVLLGAVLGVSRWTRTMTGNPSPDRTIEGTRGSHRMGLAFVLPDGWVEKGPSYPKELILQTDRRSFILVAEEPWAPNVAGCRASSRANCLTSPTDLVDWLRNATGLVSTEPRPAFVDGRDAVALDLRTRSIDVAVPFLVASDWGQIGAGPHTWELRPTDQARLYLFSEDERTVAIVISARSEGFEGFLRDAGPIVGAFDFDAQRAE